MSKPDPIPVQEASELTGGGLSLATVMRRQEEDGLNELPVEKPQLLSNLIIQILSEPMSFLLVGCGLVYFVIGDQAEALMLLGFLFLILVITILQERKAQRALEALRDLSSPRALVLRERKKEWIAGKEVVRDDLVFISEGNRVPADGILIQGSNVATDESLLTGESLPVDKTEKSKLYAGTTVTRGQGLMQIFSTGARTKLGEIGQSLKRSQEDQTGLQVQTIRLVRVVAWIATAICLFVVVIYSMERTNWLEGILVGLTLAMAILPNEIPSVLTIFLAMGAWRISQRNVLTRKLPAVESLGAATVLCVDKTGTLTLNQMTLQKLYAEGKDFDLSKANGIPEEFHEVLEYGILASHMDPFDPMELAFLNAGEQYLVGTEHLHRDWEFKKEYPLSPNLLALSHAWKPGKAGGFVIGAKGAPEAIIDLCHVSLDQARLIENASNEMAQKGLRVLGVAKAELIKSELPLNQHDFDFNFVGLVGISDPVREGVPKAVSECHTAGIRVVMMTGDHPVTASVIAEEIGIPGSSKVLTGADLEQMESSEFLRAAQETNVFSRVSPSQKLRLVEALKASGEVVAMTGDGVNDAPALKTAHIGIAMGGRGTDVARESASLVLLNDDFGSIVEAIRMGRKVYSNLQKALIYLLAVHVPIAGMSVVPVFLNMPLVFLPAHIAFLHLIIEPACSLAFENEPGDSQIMQRPPRTSDEPLMGRKALWISLSRGFSILGALIVIYFIALWRGQGEADARALVFTTLIVSNLFLIYFSSRSKKGIWHQIFSSQNPIIGWLTVGSFLLMAGVLYVPNLRSVFGFSFMHFHDLFICFSVGILSVLWIEWVPPQKKNRQNLQMRLTPSESFK